MQLSSTLSVAMKTGQVVDLLAPLLVAQHLLDKNQYSQLLQAGIATSLMGDTSSGEGHWVVLKAEMMSL